MLLWCIDEISIPYGSIKSDRFVIQNRSFQISIPYGSIKSIDTLSKISQVFGNFNSLWFN